MISRALAGALAAAVGPVASAVMLASSSSTMSATRSSRSTMVRALFRNAYSWIRRRIVSKSYLVVSKIASSAQNVTVVPVRRVASPFFSGSAGFWST